MSKQKPLYKNVWVWAAVIIIILAAGAAVVMSRKPVSTGTASNTTQAPEAKAEQTPVDKDPEAVKTAVKAYSDAYLGGHGNKVFNMLSARCAAQTNADSMISAALMANQIYGDVPVTNITANIVSAGSAKVSYEYADASTLNKQDQAWVYEQSAWKFDGCPAESTE